MKLPESFLSLFKEQLIYFKYFYSYLRYRVVVSILLNILVGVLDGFGLAMFLPLLKMVSEDASSETQDLGALQFIPDTIESMGLPLSLVTILIFLCLFFLLKGIARLLSQGYMVLNTEIFSRSIRLELVNDLNSLSFKAFVKSDVGRIQNTLTGEVGRIVNAYIAFFTVVQQAALVMVYLSFALFIDAQFALLVIIGALLTNLLYRQIYKRTRGASHQVTNFSNILEGRLIQLTTNFKYLKATGSLGTFGKKLKGVVVNVEKENRKIGMLSALLLAAKEPILIIVVSAVIFLQNQVLENPLAPILISLLFFYRSLTALIAIQNHWNNFVARTGSLENMVDFQGFLKKFKERLGEKKLERFEHQLKITDMHFSYGDKPILKGINLEVSKNETVAFVGESGSGKTTLVNILAGLIPIDKGSFEVDGVNSEELNLTTLQSRIGYITQEPVVFNDTVFNNVSFWQERDDKNLQRFTNSIKRASIEEFIETLSEGIDTELGSNGINLSGGQKQRISIARELYKEVDILIMDEATSALDSETEKNIQSNIDQLKGSYTMLIVAHRLATIKNADRIVLMDKGEIKQIGTFEELRSTSDKFRNMVEHQEF